MNKINFLIQPLDGGLHRHFPAVRVALFVALVTAATFGLTTSSRAQGGATHHEIVDRAYNAIDRTAYPALGALLDAHQPAVDGGAVFPDCCYNMPFDHDWWASMGELAHTAQFQMAYLNVVRDAFRRHSSDEADLKAISFLFGVIGHNEADNPWHFGDGSSTPAFLTAALGADPDDNEQYVEEGADVFCVFEYGEGGAEAAWDFPVETVRAAYSALGHDVPALGLQQGLDMVAAYHTYNKAATGLAYLAFQVDLVWTHNNLATYSVGGMDDAANHAADAWVWAWDELSTYKVFLPGTYNSSVDPPRSELQDGAQPAANTGQPALDELRRASHSEQYTTRMLLQAQQLIEEGVVKVHSHTKDGIYTIERVEILDQQRLNQLIQEDLAELTSQSYR